MIFAPTASGKTALTKELFSRSGSHFILNAEIVSADSQQVYKGMDIGTAKPDAAFCSLIPHHLINKLSPFEQWNVSDFVDAADMACQEIHSRGKLPVLVGGTGFYIRNFLYGVAPTPQSDPLIREKLKERVVAEGSQSLYEELKNIDPQSAAKIHPNDAYRICRALEVYYLTGQPRSSFKSENENGLRKNYDFLFIVLEPPRDLLYQRIRSRVDLMFEEGLKEELRRLIENGCNSQTPGMKAIGYSEWFENDWDPSCQERFEESSDDSCDESCKKRSDEMQQKEEIIKEEIKHHSCKYAKKQYTYIRDIPGSIRLEYKAEEDDIKKAALLITSWYKKISENKENSQKA